MKLTAKQNKARELMAGTATHCLLWGGSRSGKTALHVRQIITRALKAPHSRHVICRFRFSHCKNSIGMDTMPKVFRSCWPNLKYSLNKTDWIFTLPNGSEIWLAGLDDKERTEKILGQEFATILLNECSQIPFSARELMMTRLAQKCPQDAAGITSPLQPRMLYDCNPPKKNHWIYQLFIQGIHPIDKTPLKDRDDYCHMQMNPVDNEENLADGYIDTLKALGTRERKRFLDGEFGEAMAGQLFDDINFEKWRVLDGNVTDMVRVVVGVDPSGSGDVDNADNDAIGIVAGGLGVDGNAYLLTDATVKAGPATWGRVAIDTYDRLMADVVVGEGNYGGAMVGFVIQTAASAAEHAKVPYKMVTATRGKHVRAEPFSALYDQGKIRHVGYMRDLEEEMIGFTTNGYIGERSPNRADAAFWVLAELFGGVVAEKPKGEKKTKSQPIKGGGWSR